MIYKLVVNGRDYYIDNKESAELAVYKLEEKGYAVERYPRILERSADSLVESVEFDKNF